MTHGGHDHDGADHAHAHDESLYVLAGAEPAVFAAPADVVFAPPTPAADVYAQIEAFLRDLDDALAASDCVLVGHIKGTLETADRRVLSFSVTALGGEARVAATPDSDLGAAVLTINVIVFGVAEAAAKAAVLDCWSATAAAFTHWR